MSALTALYASAPAVTPESWDLLDDRSHPIPCSPRVSGRKGSTAATLDVSLWRRRAHDGEGAQPYGEREAELMVFPSLPYDVPPSTSTTAYGLPAVEFRDLRITLTPPRQGGAYPAGGDAMHELADNSRENRAATLFARVRIQSEAWWAKRDATERGDALWLALWAFFALLCPHEEGVVLEGLLNAPSTGPGGAPIAEALPLPFYPLTHGSDGQAQPQGQDEGKASSVIVYRSDFWQSSPPSCASLSPWLPALPRARYTHPSAMAPRSTHGLARSAALKPPPGTVLYERYVTEFRQTLRYRLVDTALPGASGSAPPPPARDGPAYSPDVQLFARWQNSERVHRGWRQRSSDMGEHYDCVSEMVSDPARFGLIGYWDDEPWGFVEVYYAKHSNVAPFYRADDRDMGFHALVGEDKFRGAHRVRAWMGAAVHLCFLLDPQTQLVVSEPRASNAKMIEYECMVGGHVEKLIDLGHKRSALVMIPRERFFQLCPMGPLPAQMEAAKARMAS